MGRPRAHAELGFAMVELLVVLLIIAIVSAIAISNLRAASRGPEAPTNAVAAGRIWRGIQLHRLEDGGVMPATSAVQGRGTGLVDAAGRPRVQPWPEQQRGGLVDVVTGTAASPPATGTANAIVYGRTSNETGWLAAYGPRGTIVFSRSIEPSANPRMPRG